MSKSEQIRRVLRTNPNMVTSDVLETLAKKKVYVTTGLVYQVRSTMSAAKAVPIVQPAPNYLPMQPLPVPTTESSQTITDVLKEVKSIATKCGGVEELRQILEYIKL